MIISLVPYNSNIITPNPNPNPNNPKFSIRQKKQNKINVMQRQGVSNGKNYPVFFHGVHYHFQYSNTCSTTKWGTKLSISRRF